MIHPKRYKQLVTGLLVLCLAGAPFRTADATVPVAVLQVIKAGVKKVIRAVDLKMQRLQNKTIWLQNAHKTLENTLSKLKLAELADWTERQGVLYKDYFQELAKVKTLISNYQRIRDLSAKQSLLLSQYQRAWRLFSQDKHFTAQEREYMSLVYAGILKESASNMDRILLVLRAFTTTMSDAKRLEIIHEAADQVDENYDDLIRFNQQNILLSLQRAKDQNDIEGVRKLYGIY